MNTVRIDPQPDGNLRCTHDDGSTFTCAPHQLADHLRECPMTDEQSSSLMSKMVSWFKPKQ